jgi:hypothetical protein
MQVDISITSEGHKVLSRIDTEYDQWLAVLKSINRAEAAELNRILDKLRT